MATVLIIEDDNSFSLLLERFLSRHGYDITIAADIKNGRKALTDRRYDLILLDYRLPDGLGLDILAHINELPQPRSKVIVMTTFNDVRTAVQTIRMGASDYITKPINPDELLHAVNDALGNKREKSEKAKEISAYVAGHSPAAQLLKKHTELVAPTDFSVIIQGESGTGKELAARTIHNLSKRNGAPFVALDCGALSAELAGSELFGHVKGAFTGALQNKTGLFEAADGGTIFLDETGNLSYDVQVKLLRAIQERTIVPLGSVKSKKVDVRIITATNENLLNAVKEGRFREDLYHRLNEFKIEMPPLRQRIEDLPIFCDTFIQQTNTELNKHITGLSNEAMDIFLHYDWPGNLRELRNIIRRAVLTATSSRVELSDLPPEMLTSINNTPDSSLKSIQEDQEKDMILKALAEARYNKSKAARILDIDRTTLYYKMNKYNIR